MTENQKRLDTYFEELVPSEGKADTLAGEIVRAAVRIIYRWENDGDQVDEGYGKETCNPAARFLMKKCPGKVCDSVLSLWKFYGLDEAYDALIEVFAKTVADHLDVHPELKTTVNTEDMLNYDEPEDYDYDQEDEEDYWYDDEEDDDWDEDDE